ncbi:MAG: hypothetical protein NC191_07380 [Muribaculaceae bacterium]|nr:hypothetical protein [Muribaculaceae bacterium]
MAISAVSSINLNSRASKISFGNDTEGDKIRENARPKRASNFVKVPVIMMMTLSPSLLSSAGAAAENYQDEMNFPQTEQLYAMAEPAPQSSRTSSGNRVSSYVRPQYVQYEKAFSSNGKSYNMYYVYSSKDIRPNNTSVSGVYFVPKGYQPINPGGYYEDYNHPPRLAGVRLHQLGNGRDFVGAVVSEEVCDKDGKNGKFIKYEIRLPDDIANGLMDLAEGKTKFKPVTSIVKMFEGNSIQVTNSAELLK